MDFNLKTYVSFPSNITLFCLQELNTIQLLAGQCMRSPSCLTRDDDVDPGVNSEELELVKKLIEEQRKQLQCDRIQI